MVSIGALSVAASLIYGMTAIGASEDRSSEDTLLIWAGDQAHKAPDFVAVVDFNSRSPAYGKVLRTVPLPSSLPTHATDGTTGAVGNEPHHIGVSADGKTFVTGGLLSVLRGQDQTFFFDVTRPRSPQFITANNPGYDPKTGAPAASIADEFEPLSNGGFLASFMGGPNGAAPGRVVEYDANHHYVNAWPADLPESGFNPHDIAVDEAHNLIVTSDFIRPLHTLYYTGNHPSAEFRGSVRVWDFKNRAIKKTIIIGDPTEPAGTINIQLIPNDPQLRAFTDGVYDGKLYLVDTENGTAKPVFNFTTDPRFINAGGAPVWPHLFRISKDSHYLYNNAQLSGQGWQGRGVRYQGSRRSKGDWYCGFGTKLRTALLAP